MCFGASSGVLGPRGAPVREAPEQPAGLVLVEAEMLDQGLDKRLRVTAALETPRLGQLLLFKRLTRRDGSLT